jgi:hypothetical protein
VLQKQNKLLAGLIPSITSPPPQCLQLLTREPPLGPRPSGQDTGRVDEEMLPVLTSPQAGEAGEFRVFVGCTTSHGLGWLVTAVGTREGSPESRENRRIPDLRLCARLAPAAEIFWAVRLHFGSTAVEVHGRGPGMPTALGGSG